MLVCGYNSQYDSDHNAIQLIMNSVGTVGGCRVCAWVAFSECGPSGVLQHLEGMIAAYVREDRDWMSTAHRVFKLTFKHIPEKKQNLVLTSYRILKFFPSDELKWMSGTPGLP